MASRDEFAKPQAARITAGLHVRRRARQAPASKADGPAAQAPASSRHENARVAENRVQAGPGRHYVWSLCERECIGSGSYGTIYRGAHVESKTPVAINMYSHQGAGPGASQEENNGLRTARAISHYVLGRREFVRYAGVGHGVVRNIAQPLLEK